MRTVGELTLRWFKDLDIGVSATWFLLFFVYVSGASQEGPVVDFSTPGVLPALRIEMLNVIFAILCLAIATVIFVEPLLPCGLRKRILGIRNSAPWQYIYRFHLWIALVLGLINGVGILVENLPAFLWLIDIVSYASLVIIVAMPLKMFFDLWSALPSQSGN